MVVFRHTIFNGAATSQIVYNIRIKKNMIQLKDLEFLPKGEISAMVPGFSNC